MKVRTAVEVAEEIVATVLTVRGMVARRPSDLPPLPAWPDGDTSDAVVARKVVGDLMAAGWTPPPDHVVAAEDRRWAKAFRDAEERYDAMTPEQRDIEFLSITGHFPPEDDDDAV